MDYQIFPATMYTHSHMSRALMEMLRGHSELVMEMNAWWVLYLLFMGGLQQYYCPIPMRGGTGQNSVEWDSIHFTSEFCPGP